MIEKDLEPDLYLVPRTNGSGRPKNIQIPRIRISNTAFECTALKRSKFSWRLLYKVKLRQIYGKLGTVHKLHSHFNFAPNEMGIFVKIEWILWLIKKDHLPSRWPPRSRFHPKKDNTQINRPGSNFEPTVHNSGVSQPANRIPNQ